MVTKSRAERVPTQTHALFELDEQPPLGVLKTFSHTGAGPKGATAAPPAGPDSGGVVLPFRTRRNEGVPALHISAFDRAEEWEREFLAGAELLGFEPTPQQWKIADAINAHGEDGVECLFATIAVCVPRRAGKTTTLLAIALGRCKLRENYVVLFTAQSGTKARDRFLAMARTLERRSPNEWERGFRILKGAGHQVVEFTNGSFLQVVPPKQESFRGDEGDLIILDEAQEHNAEVSGELLGAILPVMDTRPGAQLIIAGTAGEHRSGLFWDTLEEGRRGELGTGIVEFAAPDDTAATDLLDENGDKDWNLAEPIIVAAHPGIGTLTTLVKMQERFRKLPLPQFMREYLGVWPEDYSRGAIDPAAWRQCALEVWPAMPGEFALGFDVHPNGSSAAIAAAWRVDDHPHVEILDHRPGTEWLVPELARLATKYRAVPIGHDTVGAVLVEAEALGKKRPTPRRRPIAYREVGAMCAAFMKAINTRTLRHSSQAELNAAAAGVVKRDLGDNAWAWGRKKSVDVDITPLVAATIALRTFDTTKKRTASKLVTPSSIAKKRAS